MARILTPPYFESVVNAGEKRLLDYLEVHLPESYVLIPNIELASTNPYNHCTQYWEYDLIVVAPHAIYNIENKDWKGRIEGDDNYFFINDRQKPTPLKTGRQKTAILASKLKEQKYAWGKAWVQNLLTLSYPNTYKPVLWYGAEKLTFQLNEALISYLTDPQNVGKSENEIGAIQEEIVAFLVGVQSQKSPEEKREVEGYEIVEVVQQVPNFTEYLVKPKDVTSNIRKRVKEYALQAVGLSIMELQKRELQIKNGYKALEKIKSNPFIANVTYRLDEENHIFYEITDFLDEDSLFSCLRSKTFTFEEKISIIRNVMSALKAAHEQNVFHRDINPRHIYFRGGYAVLSDFGKSYFTDHNDQGYTVQATINESNATAYHPLELTIGEANRASDIYSLGVLIYWLFVEKEPISTPYELDQLGGKLPPDRLPSAQNSSLPKWLDELCLKTILVDDTQRIDTIEEMETFLANALKGDESQTPLPAPSPPKTTQDLGELKEGDRVGDYIIHNVLGKGGYSRVFRVKHDLQGKEYALKLFHESVNVASVLDEYKALIGLQHPHIVKFIWNGTTSNGQFYTLTEFLDGENLSTYARTEARLPIKRVYQMARDILSALVLMQTQSQPILHRDIKPQNIMWDRHQRFVLIDFNIASFSEENKDFVGTNPYLAPDLIAANHKINWDTSADTFALGVTLYELICKQYPWAPGKQPILSKAPTPAREYESRLSEGFAEFLDKAILTNSQRRFRRAQEMLDALEAIGEEGILDARPGSIPALVSKDREEGDSVKYLNSLFSQSRHGNAGTRANFTNNAYDVATYTPTKLDESLLPAIIDGQFKLLIITGNAGDGKTAFIRKIENDPQVKDLKRFNHSNGAWFKINGVQFESNYDGSQDEEEKANNEVLEEFFRPFEQLSNYNEAQEGRILAINEGRLVEFLKTSRKYLKLHDTIEEYFYNEGHHELPDGLMIINLNLRSVAAPYQNTPSLFKKQIKALTNKSLWTKCDGCDLAQHCFIKYNVDSLNDTAAGEEVITRMEWLLRTASLKRELHITMRDVRSFIAYTLTRDLHCDEIEALYTETRSTPEKYWQYYYFNITTPHQEDIGNQDRLIKLLRETDIGEVAIPNLDRDLYFGRHEARNYLEFGERNLSLLEEFNQQMVWVPAYAQTPEIVEKIKVIQKTFIRHQYFEGKAELLETQNGSDSTDASKNMPSYLLRLPYHSIFKFVQVLAEGDSDNYTKWGLSRAISLNEGCDNPGIAQTHLVLSSSEIKDPYSKSFRLFQLNDFELFVNRTDHLVKYLEYVPDSLTFRHKSEKHIKLTISLDLYEMLFFIQQGFSPSLNDLRGKFVELIIFKNLLENLIYREVVVTKDNAEFFKISKDNQSRLHIQPMEF